MTNSTVEPDCEDGQSCASMYYYHSDHLGSSTYLTDERDTPRQYVLYLPFGETMLDQKAGGYDSRYKYTGKETDENTGLNYHGARYYNSSISMWYGVDPLMEDYPAWSPFNYVMGNPIRLIDPTGMSSENGGGDPVVEITAKNGHPGFKPKNQEPLQSKVGPALPYSPNVNAGTGPTGGGEAPPSGGGFLSTAGQRVLCFIGFFLMPANGYIGPNQTTPLTNLQRFTTDPSTLSDEYLAGVRQRIASGQGTPQDYLYIKEANLRTKSKNNSSSSNALIYNPSLKHMIGGWGTYMDLNDMTAQLILNSSVPGGKQRYGYMSGKVYEFQPDNAGTYHGYPIPGEQAGAKVLETLRDRGFFNQKTYKRLVKQSKF